MTGPLSRQDLVRLTGRLGALLFTLWGATLVTFIIARIIPTNPAQLIAGDGASPDVVASIAQELGLDRPLWEQYARYLGDLLRGDLGVSVRSGEPVLRELLRAAPATIELALCAFVLIVCAALVLGALAARRPEGVVDHLVRLLSAVAISTPTFWTGLLLLWVFAQALGWAPLGGRLAPETQLESITGFVLADSLLVGRPDLFVSGLAHLALPAVTLALGSAGAAARLVRASLIETLATDYVRRVRAAGLSEWVVLTRYALPNAMIPFVTTMGLRLADLLVGAVVTEMIFGWPGLGAYTLDAIAGLDFPAILGFTLFAALVYSLANLAVDILNAALDPRARA